LARPAARAADTNILRPRQPLSTPGSGELFGGAVGREVAADAGAGGNARKFARRPLLPGRVWGARVSPASPWGAGATLAYGLARRSGGCRDRRHEAARPVTRTAEALSNCCSSGLRPPTIGASGDPGLSSPGAPAPGISRAPRSGVDGANSR
jgi:hypothetical protein